MDSIGSVRKDGDPRQTPVSTKDKVTVIRTVDTSSIYSDCPTIVLNLGGRVVEGLMDTGSQISIISESFFQQYFAEENELYSLVKGLKLVAANDLPVPIVGIVVLDVMFHDTTYENMCLCV